MVVGMPAIVVLAIVVGVALLVGGSTSARGISAGVNGRMHSSSDSSSKHPTPQVHIIRHEKDSTNNA